MIVYATKMSVKKAVAGVLVLGAVAWGVSALVPRAAQTDSAQTAQTTASDAAASGLETKLKTNEQRVALLEGYGWKVDAEPRAEREVQIPKVFDDTYQAYNELQMEQGLDLTPYQGKRATLYTYELTEYPSGAQGVTANLLVRKNRLIAADISAAEADGFVHGILGMPDAQGAAQPEKQGAIQPEEEVKQDAASAQENADAQQDAQEQPATPTPESAE